MVEDRRSCYYARALKRQELKLTRCITVSLSTRIQDSRGLAVQGAFHTAVYIIYMDLAWVRYMVWMVRYTVVHIVAQASKNLSEEVELSL